MDSFNELVAHKSPNFFVAQLRHTDIDQHLDILYNCFFFPLDLQKPLIHFFTLHSPLVKVNVA